MSIELIDFRGKITERTAQVLSAHSSADNVTQSEIVRDVLDKWAEGQIHRSMLVARLTRGKGYAEADEGEDGK